MNDSTTVFGTLPDGAEELAIVGEHQYLRCDWVHRRRSNGQLEYYAPFAAWPETPAGQIGWRDTLIRNLQSRVAELEQRLAAQASVERVELAPAATLEEAPPAESESEHACPACDRSFGSLKALRTHQTKTHGAQEQTEAEHLCPTCTKPLPSAAALRMHRVRVHGPYKDRETPAAEQPPAPPPDEEPAVPTPSGWPCAGCNVEKYPDDFVLPSGEMSRYCTTCRENRRRAREALDARQQQVEQPWSCVDCRRSGEVVTQSLRDPSRCMQCAAGRPIAGSNGHLVVA